MRHALIQAAVIAVLTAPVCVSADDGQRKAPFARKAFGPNQAARRVDLYGDPLPPGAIARLGTIRFHHPSDLVAIRFTEDGKQIIGLAENDSVPHNQALCVWDAATGRPVRTIDTAYQCPRGFAFLPEESLAATVGFYFNEKKRRHEYSIKLLNVATGKRKDLVEWQEPRGSECRHIAWVPGGTTLMTASSDGTLRVWDRASGTELLSYKRPGQRSRIDRLEISPDGKVVAVAAGRSGVYLWNWTDGKKPTRISIGQRNTISVAFSPDGKQLAAGTDSHRSTIGLIDVAAKTVVKRLRSANAYDNYVRDVRFSPDGKSLLTSGYFSNAVNVWNPSTGKLVRTIDVKPGRPMCLAVSPDSRRVAVGSDGVIRTWDLATGREVNGHSKSHLDRSIEIAICNNPNLVATSSHDGTVRVWDARTGRQKLVVQHDHPPGGFAWVRAVALSPDGKLIASGGAVDSSRLWNAKTGREIYRLPGHGKYGGRWQIAFAKDGSTFATWGDDMRLRRWDVRTGKCLDEFVLRPSGVKLPPDDELDEPSGGFGSWRFSIGPARFSPDIQRFLLHMSGSLYLFDAATGKELKRFPLPRVGALAFSPDGKRALMSVPGKPTQTKLANGSVRYSSGKDHSLVLMDLSSGRTVARVDAIDGYPGPVDFSPDGRLVATAPRKSPGRILIFSAAGKKQQTINGFRGLVDSLVFSADSRRIAGGLSDSTALIWNIKATGSP